MASGDFSPVRNFKGLALPALKGPGGLFATKSRLDVAWGDLLLAVFTPRGSRTMLRGFGTALHAQLFDPIDQEFKLIAFTIEETVRQSCPHITIVNVSVDVSPLAADTVEIGIEFALTADLENPVRRVARIRKSTVTLFSEL